MKLMTCLASVVTHCTTSCLKSIKINKHALAAKAQNTCLYRQSPSQLVGCLQQEHPTNYNNYGAHVGELECRRKP